MLISNEPLTAVVPPCGVNEAVTLAAPFFLPSASPDVSTKSNAVSAEDQLTTALKSFSLPSL